MKIAFLGTGQKEEANFPRNISGSEIHFLEGKLEDNLSQLQDTEIVSVFVNSPIDKNSIDNLPNLKLITTRSMGTDHIDLEYAKERGIKVASVPAYGSYTVAEFTFALLLNLSRKVTTANMYVRESAEFKYYSEMEGFDLFGKTIGIIGTGKIGRNVAKIANSFGMKVIATDLFPDEAFAKEAGVEYKNLDELLASADVVTLHAPYTKENHHLINRDRISKMKKGVYILNTARGELIDTAALVFGLKEGIIAGAGLDVLEGERELKEEAEILIGEKADRVRDYKTLLEDHMLMEMPNVIVTPHIAFYSREAVREILRVTEENIKSFLAGTPINLIN
jgi:D-lactate dehydrogenase